MNKKCEDFGFSHELVEYHQATDPTIHLRICAICHAYFKLPDNDETKAIGISQKEYYDNTIM